MPETVTPKTLSTFTISLIVKDDKPIISIRREGQERTKEIEYHEYPDGFMRPEQTGTEIMKAIEDSFRSWFTKEQWTQTMRSADRGNSETEESK